MIVGLMLDQSGISILDGLLCTSQALWQIRRLGYLEMTFHPAPNAFIVNMKKNHSNPTNKPAPPPKKNQKKTKH